MKRFKSILVGVDLADGDNLVSSSLNPSTREAIKEATWLAKNNSAQLTFFHVSSLWSNQLDADTQILLQEKNGKRTVMDHAKEVVAVMAEDARNDGIDARNLAMHGTCWWEIIRQVLRGNHDLVIIGNRRKGLVKGILGSTGVKLLRKCPCPVWVTKPNSDERISSILVAHDLREVGDQAMELGCSMARLLKAKLHVLHAAEYPELKNIFSARVSKEKAASYRRDSQQHIATQLENLAPELPTEVHFVTEPPAAAILSCIEQQSIDLLVMGTIARTGIPGLITGNTAERLLTQVPCSVMAVKPAGFSSPVTLDE